MSLRDATEATLTALGPNLSDADEASVELLRTLAAAADATPTASLLSSYRLALGDLMRRAPETNAKDPVADILDDI